MTWAAHPWRLCYEAAELPVAVDGSKLLQCASAAGLPGPGPSGSGYSLGDTSAACILRLLVAAAGWPSVADLMLHLP
jgi:hypothetical protein